MTPETAQAMQAWGSVVQAAATCVQAGAVVFAAFWFIWNRLPDPGPWGTTAARLKAAMALEDASTEPTPLPVRMVAWFYLRMLNWRAKWKKIEQEFLKH
jgi:hypothetical protein